MDLLHNTYNKLKEVEYFYKKIKKAEEHNKYGELIYNFSAFLCAWRSICCRVKKSTGCTKEGKNEIIIPADFISSDISNSLKKHGLSKEKIKNIKEKIAKKAYNNLTEREKQIEKELNKYRNLLVHNKYPKFDISLEEDRLSIKDELTINVQDEKGRPLPVSFKEFPSQNTEENDIKNHKMSYSFLKVSLSDNERKKIIELSGEGLDLARKFIEKCEESLKAELNTLKCCK